MIRGCGPGWNGTSLATLGLFAPGRSSGWAGVISGGVGMLAGAANLDGNDGTEKVAFADLFLGGMAVAGGLYRGSVLQLSGQRLTCPSSSAGPKHVSPWSLR
jgi:hypothetical protein